MDEIDGKLLRLLAANAEVTATELVPQLGLSIPAINKRIQKLRQSGVITRSTVLTDGKLVGKPIQAFILIVLEQVAQMESLMEAVQSDPDILECFAVTGEYDYILKVCARDIESLEQKLLRLKRRKGVAKSYTLLSLQEYKRLPTALPD